MEIRTIYYKVTRQRLITEVRCSCKQTWRQSKSFITPSSRRHGLQPHYLEDSKVPRWHGLTSKLDTARRPHLPWTVSHHLFSGSCKKVQGVARRTLVG